jgi:hypothetical protein
VWLIGAKPGECREYHRGFLAFDRVPRELPSPSMKRQQETVAALATHTWHLYEKGLALLTQLRHAEGDYSYFLIAASPPPAVRPRSRPDGRLPSFAKSKSAFTESKARFAKLKF